MVNAQAVLHGRLSQNESEAPAPLRENLRGAVEHPRGTEDQMRWVVRAMLNRRITYNDLTADNGLPSGSGQNGAYFPERRERYVRTK